MFSVGLTARLAKKNSLPTEVVLILVISEVVKYAPASRLASSANASLSIRMLPVFVLSRILTLAPAISVNHANVLSAVELVQSHARCTDTPGLRLIFVTGSDTMFTCEDTWPGKRSCGSCCDTPCSKDL